MPILNIECLICTELFSNSDDIHSTDCGHIFHHHCWTNWQEHSTQCPQCRKDDPTIHKIYLNCDRSDENLFDQINELNIKLNSSLDKISELNDEISACENNYFQLEAEYTKSQELIKKLEEKINQTDDCENEFVHLLELYNKSEDLVAELQDKIKRLTIETEHQAKELILKVMENDQLKTNETSESILQDKIQIIEQRRKHLQVELEKEITKNVHLSVDNEKLQRYIDSMILATNSGQCQNESINQPSCHKKLDLVKVETNAESCPQMDHKTLAACDKQHDGDVGNIAQSSENEVKLLKLGLKIYPASEKQYDGGNIVQSSNQ